MDWIDNKEELPYQSGDLIRVTDAGDGKDAVFVFSALHNPSYGMWWTQVIRMGRFDVPDMGGLDRLSREFYVGNGDVARIADAETGEPAEFVFNEGEWIKLDYAHSVENNTQMENLIRVQPGNLAHIADRGNGNPETFVYSGTGWVRLNQGYIVADMTAREQISAENGDVVKVLDAGTGTSETFLRTGVQTGDEWIAFARGDAGTVSIKSDTVHMENSSQISTSSKGHGNAGNISLATERVELETGASISSASYSENFGGDAGKISVSAGNSIILSGASALSTKAEGAGGGKIFADAGKSVYLLDSEISSSVSQGQGNGGDVTIGASEDRNKVSEFVILNHSSITADADFGDGGAIFIRTGNYFKSADSSVTATSRRGNRPDIPLHNNLSENDIREYVKKRKISGSTRSEEGRRCRDTFASLKKTCRKLGISFWEFLKDRITGKNEIPSLSDLIRQRVGESVP